MIMYNVSASEIGNFKPLTIFCGCTTRFVSDLVGNLEDRFCFDTAHFIEDNLRFTLL